MTTSNTDPIKVGVITDLTGPLSFMGIANANVADMVVHDLNASGGLLGRPLRLIVEDSATDDAARGGRRHQDGRRARRRRRARRHLQLDAAGDQGPRGRARAEALHLPRAVRGPGVRPADLLHRPGAGAADRAALPVAHGAHRREDLLPAVGRLHLAARAEREGPGGRHRRAAAPSWARSTTRSTTWTTTRPSSASWPAARTSCSTRSCRRGSRRSSRGCTRRASPSGAGQIVCTYFDENFLNLVPAEHVEGLYGCLDYYREVADPFSAALLQEYDRRYPGSAQFTAGSACTGMYRGLQAVGRGRHRGRLPRHRRRREGARHCEPRRRSGRSRRDGPRPAPPAAEHVHRAGPQRCLRGRREPRPCRPQGGRRRVDDARRPPPDQSGGGRRRVARTSRW